jgi:undecaprenyl-diphosphatase
MTVTPYIKRSVLPLLGLILCLILVQGQRDWELVLAGFIRGEHAALVVNFFKFSSFLASTSLMLVVVALTAGYWYWKTKELKTAAAYLMAFAFAMVVAYGLKMMLGLERPPQAGWLASAKGFTFPSGHATRITFFMTTFPLLYLLPVLQRLLIIFLVVTLVALSRVYLGVHYPLDVVAGICVGLLGASLFNFLKASFTNR